MVVTRNYIAFVLRTVLLYLEQQHIHCATTTSSPIESTSKEETSKQCLTTSNEMQSEGKGRIPVRLTNRERGEQCDEGRIPVISKRLTNQQRSAKKKKVGPSSSNRGILNCQALQDVKSAQCTPEDNSNSQLRLSGELIQKNLDDQANTSTPSPLHRRPSSERNEQQKTKIAANSTDTKYLNTSIEQQKTKIAVNSEDTKDLTTSISQTASAVANLKRDFIKTLGSCIEKHTKTNNEYKIEEVTPENASKRLNLFTGWIMSALLREENRNPYRTDAEILYHSLTIFDVDSVLPSLPDWEPGIKEKIKDVHTDCDSLIELHHMNTVGKRLKDFVEGVGEVIDDAVMCVAISSRERYLFRKLKEEMLENIRIQGRDPLDLLPFDSDWNKSLAIKGVLQQLEQQRVRLDASLNIKHIISVLHIVGYIVNLLKADNTENCTRIEAAMLPHVNLDETFTPVTFCCYLKHLCTHLFDFPSYRRTPISEPLHKPLLAIVEPALVDFARQYRFVKVQINMRVIQQTQAEKAVRLIHELLWKDGGSQDPAEATTFSSLTMAVLMSTHDTSKKLLIEGIVFDSFFTFNKTPGSPDEKIDPIYNAWQNALETKFLYSLHNLDTNGDLQTLRQTNCQFNLFNKTVEEELGYIIKSVETMKVNKRIQSDLSADCFKMIDHEITLRGGKNMATKNLPFLVQYDQAERMHYYYNRVRQYQRRTTIGDVADLPKALTEGDQSKDKLSRRQQFDTKNGPLLNEELLRRDSNMGKKDFVELAESIYSSYYEVIVSFFNNMPPPLGEIENDLTKHREKILNFESYYFTGSYYLLEQSQLSLTSKEPQLASRERDET